MTTGLSHFIAKTSLINTKSNLVRSSSARYTPNIVAVAQDQKSYWASIDEEIQTYLKKAIPIRSPEVVFEPMHHITFAAPRTTAPALCVAACEVVGGDRSQAMASASAIHLMHAAAYVHEHLPLTDRQKPKATVQHKYTPNIELLTGDGIIPFGLELLARSMDLKQAELDKILRVIIEITRAIGSQGMVDGQYQELGLLLNDDDHGGDFEHVCRKKEGELHACGAACGAILGGGDEDEIVKLRNFGLYAGMIRVMSANHTNPGIEEKIEKLKKLAMKELESLKQKNTEVISSLVCEFPTVAAMKSL